MVEKCAATAASGKPCSALARPGSRFCRWHDQSEAAVEERREASRRGGHARSAVNRALTAGEGVSLRDVQQRLAGVAVLLSEGKFDPAAASAMASVARALVAMAELVDQETQFAALEPELAAYRRRSR